MQDKHLQPLMKSVPDAIMQQDFAHCILNLVPSHLVKISFCDKRPFAYAKSVKAFYQ